jgi:hypothetical protein
MAKLNRESRLRDKRIEKQARKAARQYAAALDRVDATPAGDQLGGGSPDLDAREAEDAEPDPESDEPGGGRRS